MSGVTVNTSVTFFAQMEMTQSLTVMINDDSVALENDEVFDIAFTSSSLSDNVVLGPNTGVTIIDTDGKREMCVQKSQLTSVETQRYLSLE